MAYSEEDFLQLSGLQHFRFCRRRWALIHIEHQWAENYRTIDGAILHENAHDTAFQERRGDRVHHAGRQRLFRRVGCIRTVRCTGIPSGRRGESLSPGKRALWQPYPVEYKPGAPARTPVTPCS